MRMRRTSLSWSKAIAKLCFFSIIFINQVLCSPPENPIRCTGSVKNTNCTITNSLGVFPDRSICRAAITVYPTTEAELISAVANATAANKKMKVGTRYSHSYPKLVCPDGQDGVLISTNYLNRTLEVNASAMTMTVQSGVTLRQLIEDAAKANLALPYTPYWEGVTVGGMLSTGSHGSSLWGLGSQVHDYVIRMRIVSPGEPHEGYAKVRLLKTGNPELDAAKVSLGVLGVISQVTFQLQPLSKRSVTYVSKSDTNFEEDVVGFGRQYEFGDFTWNPSQNVVVYRYDHRVPTNTSGNGLYDFMGFRSISAVITSDFRATEEAGESHGDAEGMCGNGSFIASTLREMAYGLTNDGTIFEGYPVVGYQHRIQSSGSCLRSPDDALATVCPWDPRVKGILFHETGISIGLSRVQSFIQDVKKLVALVPQSLCGVDRYYGILLRYVTASSAYLGKQEDSINFDFTYYRSANPLKPRLFEDILEEIEQMAVFKYNGLPHWGKNRNVAFVGAIDKFKNAAKFVRIKNMYDPRGLFSSKWTDQILGLKPGLGNTTSKGCALEGVCICSEDVHCAPDKGYLCRHGKVYKDARVCAKVG